MNAAEFYGKRDLRTLACGGEELALQKPVGLVVGEDAAGSRSGQLLALALINMLARVHRSAVLVLPSAPLRTKSLAGQRNFQDEGLALAKRIDPFGEFRLAKSIPTGIPSIGVGLCASVATWYVGGKADTAILSRHPVPQDPAESALLGSALAACMGAASLFKLAHGLPISEAVASAWGMDNGEGVAPPFGPLDVGYVVVVGSGAVGAALGYWAREVPRLGRWVFLDADHVALHNTNRGLLFFPDDTEFARDIPMKKSLCVASRAAAEGEVAWYDEWASAGHRPDLILPLANERGVRAAIDQRGEPVLLHATTSQTWEAQFHRHLARTDDCIQCRMAAAETLPKPAFPCSTGQIPVGEDQESADAALPFLSAAAGLLLLTGLYRLQHGGLQGSANLWRLNLLAPTRPFRRAQARCREGCRTALPAKVLEQINRGRRWAC